MGHRVEIPAAQAAKIRVLLPFMDERLRRLFLGAEARALGHGGIRAVAAVAGVAVSTVSSGVAELEGGAEPSDRVRRPGAGRKRLVELHPELRTDLLGLVEPDMRGDPMSPLRWTTKSLRHLAKALSTPHRPVGRDTVAWLLHEEGFSLQATAKVTEGAQHPDRDAQFRHIYDQVTAFQASGDPVVSIDAKKKEQIGPYAVAGREWHPGGQPTAVCDHSFPNADLGKVIPFGIYDLTANTGWVNVGCDHNTAAFAVASLRQWWTARGRHDYPTATRLLITADAGGANDTRSRTFKAELAAFALDIGIPVSVCHFPPGTSKWNAIEHRLFSHITMNWRGRPLENHEVVVNTIRATTTETGLRVHAELDTTSYPTGRVVDDAHFHALPITRHTWHGEWNYTLRPEPLMPTPPPPRPPQAPTASTPTASTPPPPNLVDHTQLTHPILAHPALTGLDTTAWRQLQDRYLPLLQDRHDTRLRQLRERRTSTSTSPAVRRNGRRPTHTHTDDLLATVLRYRFGLSYHTLAELFGVKPATANTMVHRVRQLFLETGYPITEPLVRLDSLDALIDYATQAGIDITPAITPTTPTKIKNAC